MVNRRMRPVEALKLVRKIAREKGLTVQEVKGRGKGSHRIYALTTPVGAELARFALTDHPKDLSWTVLHSLEDTLTPWLGERWTEKR